MFTAGAGEGRCFPFDTHRRRPATLSRCWVRRPRRGIGFEKAGSQLRPWRSGDYVKLGKFPTGGRSWSARPPRAGGRYRFRSTWLDDGAVDPEAGFPAAIYAKALPPHTTSNIAGGQISPFGHYKESAVTPEWRRQFMAAMDYSWRRWQIMVGDEYGIRWLPTFEETRNWNENPLDPYFAGLRRVTARQHPFPVTEDLLEFETMYVETGHFLRQMMRDISIAGGTFAVREFRRQAGSHGLIRRTYLQLLGTGIARSIQ